jgi:hypothetical protein
LERSVRSRAKLTPPRSRFEDGDSNPNWFWQNWQIPHICGQLRHPYVTTAKFATV